MFAPITYLSVGSLLIATLIRSTFIFGTAVLITSLIKRLSPEIKHLIWLLVIMSTLIICLSTMIGTTTHFSIVKLQARQEALSPAAALFLPQSSHTELAFSALSDSNLILGKPVYPRDGFNLYFSLFIVWLTGFIFSSISIIAGITGIWRFKKTAYTLESGKVHSILQSLKSKMDIHRKILLMTNSVCTVPVTFNVMRPVIIIPFNNLKWPDNRMKSVLTHELAHIKRLDYATQLVSRIICSVFWFIPTLWVAYAYLRTEQEKSCDYHTLYLGTAPEEYAHHLINIARFAKKRQMLTTGIFLTVGGIRILEKRIVSILRNNYRNKRITGNKAKALFTLSFMCLMLFIVFNPTIAEHETYIPVENEELYGMWITPAYDAEPFAAKVVMKSDGTWDDYNMIASDKPSGIGIYTITGKWTDSENRIWYTFMQTSYDMQSIQDPDTYYCLARINEERNVLEELWSSVDYPTQFDKENLRYYYRIRYRQ